MTKAVQQNRDRLDDVDWALLRALAEHPQDLVRHVSQEVGLSRQAVHRRVSKLIEWGWVTGEGETRARLYRWRPLLRVAVPPGLAEDRVWRESLLPALAHVPQPALEILAYGVQEVINNAVDHSAAQELVLVLKPFPDSTEVYVEDDGVGVFRKLVRAFSLEDERHAAFELSKGKLTSDPQRHTGEGLFFTSRACDRFLLWSGSVCLGHAEGAWNVTEDLQLVEEAEHRPGTAVRLCVHHTTERSLPELFERFTIDRDVPEFARTSIVVKLAGREGESFVSRSQARRIMARTHLFSEVVLDFDALESIGPAFADEIFRVHRCEHPELSISTRNTTARVDGMIQRAERARERQG